MLTIENYKKLDDWKHDSKDFRIGPVYETQILYSFDIRYDSIFYSIKIFREANVAKHYKISLRDGSDMTEYGYKWISKNSIEIDKIIDGFEMLIIHKQWLR
jgi:hypothetical protein